MDGKTGSRSRPNGATPPPLVVLPKIPSASEPAMKEQRPSMAAAQDISHILNKAFGSKLTRQPVDKEAVSNLATTLVPDDAHHDQYVRRLAKLQEERNLKIQKLASVERMIIQARARAISHYEQSMTNNCDVKEYECLMDSNLLREHNLIVPEDLFADPYEYENPGKAAAASKRQPNFARSTTGSRERTRLVPRDDGYSQTVTDSPQRRSNNSSPEPVDFQELIGTTELWQEMPDGPDRAEAKKYLSIMNARQQYLRNPASNNKLSPSDPEYYNCPFRAIPPKLVFTKYSIGKAYQMSFELKNMSTCQRSVRIVPPKSNKFSISLGSFPSGTGFVAPGLSCQYTVSFVPETLADCDDELVVQTDGFSDMILPVKARRPPPILSIGNSIDAGHCLVGGAKLSQFTFTNEGGGGCFFVLPKSKWPATGYKSSVQGGRISEPPFEVRPAMFQAPAGGKVSLEVLFMPKEVGRFEADLMFVCDNCNVKQVKVVGHSEVASVKLADVSDEALQEPEMGEAVDHGAEKFLRFPPINPMTYSVRKLTVQNETHVAMRFSWQVLRPAVATPEAGENKAGNEERSWDLSSPFSVSPSQAEVPAGGTVSCSVVFAAPYANSFHNVLHMVLHNVPQPPPAVDASEVGDSRVVRMTATGEMKPQGTAASSTNATVVTLDDVIGLRVDVKGDCIPYNLSFVPYSLDLVGKTLIGTTARKPFQMLNNSVAPVYFRWKAVGVDEHEIIEIDPSEGEIAEGHCASFEVALSRNVPGPIERNLICEIEHQESAPVSIKLTADIQGPIVSIETESVDFGLVRRSETARRAIAIRNKSSVEARWTFEVKECNDLRALSTSGFLGPLGEGVIELEYSPSSEADLNGIGHLRVENGGPESFLEINGHSQTPTLCLLKSEEDLGVVYLQVPVSTHVQLHNQTDLPTAFRWGQAKGADSEHCNIQVFPSEAVIPPRGTISVEVQLTCSRLGDLQDVLVPCSVDGRENLPLWLRLRARVDGLNVEYAILDPECPDSAKAAEGGTGSCHIALDNVAIGQPVTRKLLLRNTTAIAAPYVLGVRNFAACAVPERVSRCLKAALNEGERVGLLRQTPHLADPYSITLAKAIKEYEAAVLRNDRGLAVTLSHQQGVLGPFSELEVEVTCYSDMWGKYSDLISCEVGDLSPRTIPLSVNVCRGSPITYQLMGALNVQEPIIRFGAKVHGSAQCSRSVQVNNTGPVGLTVYWECQDFDSESQRVVDLKMFSGRPFGDEPEDDEESVPSDRPSSPPAVSDIPAELEVRDLLSLKVMSHEGMRSTTLFAVQPETAVYIPPRSNVKLCVTFNPHSEDGLERSAFGFCRGFLSLHEQGRVSPGVVRCDQYDVDPVRFWLSGTVMPAVLDIELDDATLDEGIWLEGCPSLLLDHAGQMKDMAHSAPRQSIKLSNASEAIVQCQVLHSEFVSMWRKDSGGWQPLADEHLLLQPRTHVQLHAALRLTKLMVDGLIATAASAAPDENGGGIQVEKTLGGGRLFRFPDAIHVQYPNGSQQVVPVNIQVTLPNFSITKTLLDFGPVFVGTTLHKELELINKTGSGSVWRLEPVPPGGSGLGQFNVSPTSGYLEPYLSGEGSKQVLEVKFDCRTDQLLEASYRISGAFGEDSVVFTVRANGSFDAHYLQGE